MKRIENSLLLSKYSLRNFFENFPRLFLFLVWFRLKFRGWGTDRGVLSTTEVVIDGFPRSANSFATKAFRVAQGRKMVIGNHTHSRTNIIEGIRRGLPTLLLIRNPKDALLGLATTRPLQIIESYDAELFKFSLYARRYRDMYRPLLRYRYSMLVADFSIVVSDYTSVIKELNKIYSSDFGVFEHSEENVKAVFESAGEYLSPSPDRAILKQRLKDYFEDFEKTSIFLEINELYEEFIDHPRVMKNKNL